MFEKNVSIAPLQWPSIYYLKVERRRLKESLSCKAELLQFRLKLFDFGISQDLHRTCLGQADVAVVEAH